MVAGFVDMIRTGSPEEVASFYACLRNLYHACTDETFAAGIATLIATRPLVPGILRQRDVTELDPAIPAFLQVAAAWDQELPGAWEVVHDESKPLAVAQDVIECFFANEAEPRRRVGTGPRAVTLPLKATGLRFESSSAVPGLQVADLFASSLAYFLRGVVAPQSRGDFWERLRESHLMEIGVGAMWPSIEVDPQNLEMEEYDGSWVEASSGLSSGARASLRLRLEEDSRVWQRPDHRIVPSHADDDVVVPDNGRMSPAHVHAAADTIRQPTDDRLSTGSGRTLIGRKGGPPCVDFLD